MAKIVSFKDYCDPNWKDGEYEYFKMAANICHPTYQVGKVYEDGTDATYDIPDDVSSIGWSVFRDMECWDNHDYVYFPVKTYDDDSIVATLKALHISPEKFWHAIRFVNAYANTKFSHGALFWESNYIALNKILDGMRTSADPEKFDGKIIFKSKVGKTVYEMEFDEHINALMEGIQMVLESHSEDIIFLHGQSLKSFGGGEESFEKPTAIKQAVYEARVYKQLLDQILEGQPVRKGHRVSLDKMLLISKIIYMERVLRSDSLRFSSDTLKSYMKKYRNEDFSNYESSRFVLD